MDLKSKIFPKTKLAKLLSEVSIDIRKMQINPDTAVVVNVDVINGFFKSGALASVRLEKIIPKIERVNEEFINSRKIFFVDTHTQMSTEFSAYPPHCISENERQIVKELDRFTEGSEIIKKNCTNAFLCQDFVKWLAQNLPTTENFIITGGATDICVLQFALTLKAYLNEIDSKVNVIAVENAIQTFDNEAHDGNYMHSFAMYNMYINGIIPVRI